MNFTITSLPTSTPVASTPQAPTTFKITSLPTTQPTQQAAPSFAEQAFGNAPATGFFSNLVKNTIGSNGIGGLVARPIVAAETAGATQDVAQHKGQLAQVTNALLTKINSLPVGDPRRETLMDVVRGNQNAMGIANDTLNSLQNAQETQEQNLGIAANAASTLATGATGAPLSVFGRTLADAGNLGSKVIEGATIGGLAGAGTPAANNQSAGDVVKGALGGAALGAALPFGTVLAKTIAKPIAGALSGAGSDVIDRALKNPDAISGAITKYATTPELKQDLVTRARSAITSFLQNRSQQYGDTLNTLTSKAGFQGKQAVLDSFEHNVQKFGGKITNSGDLTFANSALTPTDQRNLQSAWTAISGWKNTSVKGLDTLRQAIGNFMDDFNAMGNSRANEVLGHVNSDLTSALNENVPGYKAMLSTYGDQTQLAKNLSKELSLNGNAKESTQLSQIMRLFQKDPNVMNDLTQVMGKSKANSFLNELSGAILSSWLPAGRMGNYARALGEGGALGGALFTGNPAAAVTIGGGIAASSPRIVGRAATAAGKVGQTVLPTIARRITTVSLPKL